MKKNGFYDAVSYDSTVYQDYSQELTLKVLPRPPIIRPFTMSANPNPLYLPTYDQTDHMKRPIWVTGQNLIILEVS